MAVRAPAHVSAQTQTEEVRAAGEPPKAKKAAGAGAGPKRGGFASFMKAKQAEHTAAPVPPAVPAPAASEVAPGQPELPAAPGSPV